VLFGEFSADRWWICLDITTEQVYWSDYVSDSNSASSWFESRPRQMLSWSLLCFSLSLQANSGTAPQIRPWPVPIHYLLLILPFDTVQSEFSFRGFFNDDFSIEPIQRQMMGWWINCTIPSSSPATRGSVSIANTMKGGGTNET
jgi:hypothetical protein